MFSPVRPSLDPWPSLENDDFKSWNSVRISRGVSFLLITDSSGVLMTTDLNELQSRVLEAPQDVRSVHLAYSGGLGLQVYQVQSVYIFEEIRPAGGIRHHVSYKFVDGSTYSESEPSAYAVGKAILIYRNGD